MSLENTVKGIEFVDFEKINSLEGVFIANKYEEYSGNSGPGYRHNSARTKSTLTN